VISGKFLNPMRALQRPNREGFLATMSIRLPLCSVMFWICVTAAAAGQQLVSAPEPQAGTIIGTVTDVNNGTVPGATVVVEGTSAVDHASAVTDDRGFFQLDHLASGKTYRVTIRANGFAIWTSPAIVLKPGQYLELTGIQLQIAEAVTTVHAVLSDDEIATEQVKVEEKQRVLGIFPNFYAVYDPHPVPLTPKLKFRLAVKTATDPVTFLGATLVASVDQAADTPNYVEGAKGYGQRLGANYANGLSDIMIGGAILPTILRQDPRYFYQGTGTTKSRMLHALSTPFICRGDSGRREPNYSALGGYASAGALANTYYPASNRGAGLFLSTTFIDIGSDMVNGVIQEFFMRRFTPTAKSQP
jgi:hypothetical protein